MAMARSVATRHARYVSKLLLREAWEIGRSAYESLSITLRLAAHFQVETRKTLSCEIKEILVFGSLARGQLIVGDVDLIVLDEGFYSPAFESNQSDTYRGLARNLSKLFVQWFELPLNREPAETALKHPVDLHVLPKEILWDEELRTRLLKRHRDPRFFENAFSSLLRFNEKTGTFERTNVEELIRKHRPPAAQEVVQQA